MDGSIWTTVLLFGGFMLIHALMHRGHGGHRGHGDHGDHGHGGHGCH